MNYYEHHIGDFIKDTIELTLTQDGAYRRLIDQYYARQSPLPLDLKECHKLARATNAADRAAVTFVVTKFFKRTTDGWRQKRCDEHIAAYLEGEPERQEKRENGKERKRRSRARRRQLFDQLRERGITPEFDATIAQLEALLSKPANTNGHAKGHGDQSVTGHKKSQSVTRDGTVTVTCDGTATQSQSHFPVPNTKKEKDKDTSAAKTPPTDPPWLADFKMIYPERAGDPNWRGAIRAANARFAEGHTPEQFIEGATRYHEFCRVTEKIGTEFVKQASTFLGPSKPFLELWKPPATSADVRLSGNLDAAAEFMRNTEPQH